MDKKILRQDMKKRRRIMPESEKIEADGIIRDKLKKHLDSFGQWILFYVSYGTEVDTRVLIGELLENKKETIHIAVPKVNGDEMEFYEIKSLSDLSLGYMGILEPRGEVLAHVEDAIMIMPGLVFDINRNRIGYGGGYYDRYISGHLSQIKETVALAYDFQVIEGDLEVFSHDIKPDLIITEKGVYK